MVTKQLSVYFVSVQEKSDSSDAGKESSSDAGPDGQDASSSSSSKTKDATPGYEEKVVRTLFSYKLTLHSSLLCSWINKLTRLSPCVCSKQTGPTDLSTC